MPRITDGKVSSGCPIASSTLGLDDEAEWKSFQFQIHNFASLMENAEKCDYIDSPDFTYNGHQWYLRVYPCGDKDASDGFVSVEIRHFCIGNITIDFQFSVLKPCGTPLLHTENFKEELDSFSGWGWDIIHRLDVLDEDNDVNYLRTDGSLTIVVSMKEHRTIEFTPENPLVRTIRRMYNDEETADVSFEVVNSTSEEEEEINSSVTFHAHRFILRQCAPILADLLGEEDKFTISDVTPNVFEHLLYYVYGGVVLRDDFNRYAKEIIDAADKYAIVNLKLTAEVAYVELTEITFDNAIDNLLYADGKNCALLKEKVISFLAEHPNEAAKKISFVDCPGHVMKDLLIAVGKKDKNDTNELDEDELSTLGVSALRKELQKLGLEVDGSREAMIEAIKKDWSS